jgi:hypothetical protein
MVSGNVPGPDGKAPGVRLTLAATGPLDPAQAWERYAEPARWSSWSPQVRFVSTTERIRPGLRGRVDGVVPFVVLDVDEAGRRWSWVAGRRPLRVHLEHTVAPAASGARTTLTLVGPPWLVLPYVPLAQLALHRLVS